MVKKTWENGKATGVLHGNTKFTEEIFDEILKRISEGETLRDICRDDHMPNYSTVYSWLKKGDDIAQRFARARDIGFGAIAEDCMKIADDGQNDWMERKGKKELNSEHVQRSKLRIETRLKLLGVWDPKRYGTKIDHSSSDGTMSPKELPASVDDFS